MSSLAAARADNFYVPNDEKVDSFRNRKRKLKRRDVSVNSKRGDKGGLVIRFAMPYNGACLQCGAYISQGTRFYAKKQECGKYLETIPIFRFSDFSCNTCRNPFVVETDPKNSSYIYVSGCKRSDLSRDCFEEVEEDEIDPDGINCAALDPIEELELAKEEQARQNRLQALLKFNKQAKKHDYSMNAKLRKDNRRKRKKEEKLRQKARQLGLGDSSVQLLPFETEDQHDVNKRRKKKVVKVTSTKLRKRLLEKSSIF